MAKENKKIISRERTDTVVYENDGHEALRFGFESTDYEEGDTMSTLKEADNIVGSDGMLINVTQILNAGQHGMLKRCDICLEESQRFLFPTSKSSVQLFARSQYAQLLFLFKKYV